MDSQNRIPGSPILWRLIPQHWTGYALIICILFAQSAQYLWRVQRDEFIMDAGLGLFFIAVPLLVMIIPIITGLGIGIVWYTIRTRGNLAPMLTLCIGYMVVQHLPLPPSPAETTFYEQRAAYEAVVRTAQHDGLGHNADCGYAFALPEPYAHLTRTCVFLVEKPALAIAFSPPTSHHVIAYAERPEALNGLEFCGVDGSVFKHLEGAWYICTPAQD